QWIQRDVRRCVCSSTQAWRPCFDPVHVGGARTGKSVASNLHSADDGTADRTRGRRVGRSSKSTLLDCEPIEATKVDRRGRLPWPPELGTSEGGRRPLCAGHAGWESTMPPAFEDVITSEQQLREIVGVPSDRAKLKERGVLDEH